MTISIVAVIVVAIVLVVIVASTSRRTDPIVRRYTTYASHRGWSRIPADQTKARLEPFGEYLDSGASIRVAIAGPLGSGRGLAAVVEQREGGRPWYVAVADSDALLDATPVQMDPRAVRTVRVMDVREVQVDESRIARGWRVTSPQHDAAEAWLHTGRRAVELSDVLHRPHPWVFGIRVRPGSVAVHLVRREEHVADADDLARMVTLVGDLARALDVTPVGGGGSTAH
jgi:hypothetical protein